MIGVLKMAWRKLVAAFWFLFAVPGCCIDAAPKSPPARIEIWKSQQNGKWYYHKVAEGNNEVLSQGEPDGYSSRSYLVDHYLPKYEPGLPVREIRK